MRKTTTKAEVEEVFASLPRLYTARYGNKTLLEHPAAKVRITAGRPPKVKYEIAGEIRGLAPAWTYMKDPQPVFTAKYRTDLERRGGAPYFAHKFQEIATRADAEALVLLCFEDLRTPGLWCHRRLFADWWLQQTGIIVEEVAET